MRAIFLTLGALALALGCEKTEEAVPSDSGPIIRDVGFADTGAVDAASPTDTGADVPATDVPTADVPATDVPTADVPATDVPTADVPTADVPTADVPTADVPADGGSCVGDGGCYACAPTTTPQFLNHCTGATCTPFNNTARLPLLRADGGLPPLP